MSYAETMIKKFGSEETWKEYVKSIASKGGKNSSGYAYAHGKVSPSENGKLGGTKSRRKPKVV